jgi:hypothetical protein
MAAKLSTIDLGDRMRNIFSVRIVRAEYKVLYVILACGVAFGIASGLIAIGLPSLIEVPIALAMNLCIFLYGARVFRGPNELVEPARPWWKMTAEGRLSFLLGLLFALLAIIYAGVVAVGIVVIFAASNVGSGSLSDSAPYFEVNVPIFLYLATLAFFYVSSSSHHSRIAKLDGKSRRMKRSRSGKDKPSVLSGS